MQRSIRTSGKAIVIRDGKLLALSLKDGDEIYYILPGGGQDAEETLPEAVVREVREETSLNVEVRDLLFVMEGVHGESFHRVDLIFECVDKGKADNVTLHRDHHQVGVAWLDLQELNRAPLYPSKLRRPIMNFYAGKPFPHYLGNEEIGDPEITD